MSSKLSEVIIRKAGPEDYEDLMEIGDAYFGKDYFPAQYHSYFKNPNIYPIVAEVDGKAVGFYMSHVIDNGQTVIKRAGRVHPAYRGYGIFHLMSEALDKHRQEYFPDVKYEVFGITNKVDRAAKEFQEKGFVHVIKKRLMHMFVRIKDLRCAISTSSLINDKRVINVTKMSHDDFQLLFSNDEAVNRLFPKRLLFNWYVGFKIHEDNIRYIINDNEFVFASTSQALLSTPPSSYDSVQGQTSQNFSQETINKIDIISCARKHQAVIGLCYEIDIYTADGYEERMIKPHLVKHFEDFNKSTNEDGIIIISFNSNVNEELIISYLREFGIVDVVPEMETYKSFYEKKL